MSLFRPIPPLTLAANVDQPLSPLNLRDYGKLLYWIFFFPQAIRDYVGPKAALATIKARQIPTATAPDAESDKADQNREMQQRQRVMAMMSALLLLALTAVVALVIFFIQMRLDLRWGAALNSALGAPLGLLLAGIVFLVARGQKQPANGIVLGVATGLTTTIISMFGLGELLDDHFLGMGRALGYGFLSGSSVGILSNLATTLAQPAKARPTSWHAGVGALVSGLAIFLINSFTPSDALFALTFSQENGLAILSGGIAFFSGAQLGQQRPLDWLLSKIRLNWQLFRFTQDQQLGKFTEKATVFTHYAPGLEALFAPLAPVQLPVQPALPHVTYYPIAQLRLHVETWLDHEWERALTNADQLWRYTNQQKLLIGAVQQVLQEKSGEDQVTAVAQFVNKVGDIAWAMILYPLNHDALTVAKLQAERQPKPPADKVMATTVQTKARRYEHQRWQIRQEVTDLRGFGHLPLDTAAQKTVAGFWYLHNRLIDESVLAFEGLPTTDLTKELQAIAATIEKLLHAKNLLVDAKLEWPERPKEPKRKATWDAFDKFKLVVRYGRLYHQCQDAQKRQDAHDMAAYQMELVRKDESKLPSAERPILKALMDLWDKELDTWQQDTRTWQRMKPSNPFIFLDALRNRTPFVGRDGQLKELKQACSRGSLQPVLLSGPRNSGKSSLIIKAMFDYKDDICFATFHIPDPGSSALSPISVHWAMYQNLKRRIGEKISDEEEEKFQANPAHTTEKLIRELCMRYKTPVVIAIGNIEQLYPHPTRTTYTNDRAIAAGLFAYWWRLMQSVGNLNFVFVSEAPDLPNTPFTSSLKKIHLKNLESKDVHKLLTTPNAEFIPLFAPATAEYIYELTVGQPYLVQMIAHAVTDRFNRELDKDNKPEPVFTKADVDAVLEGATFDQFGQPYVQSQRDRLPLDQPIYAAVLRTIAQDEKGISAADLDAALQSQYPWSAVELILAVLEEQQVIRLNKDRWQVGELLRRALIN
jgi:hypothetical protein